MTFEFYIDVEDSSGNRLGSGPLTTAQSWTFTQRMDRAGDFSCVIDANDDMASYCTRKRILRAKALVAGTWQTVGAGIIDNVARSVQANGATVLTISGPDLTGELTYRSVGALELESSGGSVTHSAALTSIAAFAPSGWTITPDGSPPNDAIYGRFNGDTVLAALTTVAEKTQTHFYRSADRAITFASTFDDSGVRAIQASIDDLATETAAIVGLTATYESYDLLTRIYPRGSGNGDVQLTLAGTTRTAPTGYTLSAANNYIEHDAATATYGRIEAWLDYREIGPLSNSSADLQAAANMLFDVAQEELARRVEQAEATYYDVALAGCSTLVRPLQTVRLVYRDDEAGLDVDAALNVLESTWRVDTTGIQTTALTVASVDRWPQNDVDAIVGSMTQGQTYQALPQLNANSYVTAYNKNVDANNEATFRFRFGDEVVQVQQVLFEFQLLPFESTIVFQGDVTGGSGELGTGAPSVNETGTGGNDSTGSGGGGDTGSATPAIGSATPAIGTTTPTIGAATPDIGSATPAIGSSSLTTNAGGAPTTGLAGDGSTGSGGGGDTGSGGGGDTGGTGLTTNDPVGGDVISAGRHQHTVTITLGSTVTYPIGFSAAGTAGGLVSSVAGSTFDLPTSQQGNHTHTVSSHTHTINSHTHTVAAHTHTISDHTHAISGHTHSITAHTHSISAHTHTIASHDHTISAHTHTIAGHTHTIAGHTHTIAAHTHTMANHTHSLNNHTHDLSASVNGIYGIIRQESSLTYEASDLEMSVNGDDWGNPPTEWQTLSLPSDIGLTDAGDGWYQIDITDAVVDTTVPGRPKYSNNEIIMRVGSTAFRYQIVGITTIEGDTSLRQVIQLEMNSSAVVDALQALGADFGPVILSGTDTAYDSDATNEWYLYEFDSPSTSHLTLRRSAASIVWPTLPASYTDPGGIISLNYKTVNIDAQLSVRNVIQAIAYN